MRSMKARKIEDLIIDGFSKTFNGGAKSFVVMDSTDRPYPLVRIRFTVYDYFIIDFVYDKGGIGCSIVCGEYCVGLDSSEEWFDEADLDKFFQDIKSEIELRIPDKFLKAKGWMKL